MSLLERIVYALETHNAMIVTVMLFIYKDKNTMTPQIMPAYSAKVAVAVQASSLIQKSSTTVSISPSLPKCR